MQRAQAEVAETVVGAVGEGLVDQGVEPGGVGRDEGRGLVRDQPLAVAGRDRGGEGERALAGRLGGDGEGQQPRGQPGVLGLLGDQPGGGLGGQRPQFGRVRTGMAAAQRGGGDLARVGGGQIGGEVGQGAQQRGSRAVGRYL